MNYKVAHALLAVTAAALAFFSCTREERAGVTAYEYRLVIADSPTKAFLGDDGVFWEEGDKVGLFTGSGTMATEGSVDVSTNPKTIVFSSLNPLNPGTTVYACYPYTEGNYNVAESIVPFPSLQDGGSISAMPMAGIPFQVQAGIGNKGAIHFVNLGSVIDFRLFSSSYSGEQLSSITLSVNSGTHPISGQATIDLSAVAEGSVPELVWQDGPAASSVTLSQAYTVPSAKDAATQEHLYMVVAPGTYSGTISVLTDTAEYSYSFSDITFSRGGLRHFNLNLESVNATRAAVFPLESEKMGQYLDYVEQNPYDPSNYSVTYVRQFSNTTSSSNRLDMPRSVTVTWAGSQQGTKSIEVYYDPAHTQEEKMTYVEFSGNSANIYNLIPNRHYYYVVKAGGTEVGSGEFRTSGHRRIINVAGSQFGNGYANNCRDIGGLPTTDGRTLKYGKIFRGTNMDKTTSAQKTYITDVMGVGLDVDLRSGRGSSWGDGSNMYNGLGLTQIPASSYTSNTSGTYSGHTQETYNSIDNLTDPTKMGPTLTRIINAVENGVGVYIHCKVGADRTGFVCLMLESILGVKQELCDVDYELTSFCAAVDDIVRERGNKTKTYYYYPLGIERINQRPGNTFQEKAIDYVVNVLGVPQERVTAFQNCMLEPAG